jgi:predicted permease
VLAIFANVVLPVLTVAAFGFVLARVLHPNIQSLSQVSLYVLSPCLAFNALIKTTLSPKDGLDVVLFNVVFVSAMLALCWLIAWAARMDRALTRAFMLAALFMNAGNYGLSVALLAFGQPGLERAVLFFVIHSVLTGTLAIYLASSSRETGLRPLLTVLRMPSLYAAAGGLAVNLLHVPLPAFVTRSTEMLSGAALPSMLLVLGMQLAGGATIEAPSATALAVLTRLVLSVFVALGVATLLGIEGITRDVLIAIAAMPTAVFTIILATEFNARPRFVTSVVLVGTAASIGTLTVVLTLLVGPGRLG